MNWPDDEQTCHPFRNRCAHCGTLWASYSEQCPQCSSGIVWRMRDNLASFLISLALHVAPPSDFEIVVNPDYEDKKLDELEPEQARHLIRAVVAVRSRERRDDAKGEE